MADYIQLLDKEDNIIRQVTISKCGLHHNYRDYLGPDIPEFQDHIPDYLSLLPRELDEFDGEYIRRGGPLVRSNVTDEVDQVSLLRSGADNIILFSFISPLAKKIYVEYDTYKKSITIDSNSSSSKKVLEVLITTNDEINPISIFYLNDEQIISLKNKLNHGLSDLMSSKKFEDEIAKSYLEGNKFLNKIIGSAVNASLDISTYFNKRFKTNEIK